MELLKLYSCESGYHLHRLGREFYADTVKTDEEQIYIVEVHPSDVEKLETEDDYDTYIIINPKRAKFTKLKMLRFKR